jgi:hypothetical protein
MQSLATGTSISGLEAVCEDAAGEIPGGSARFVTEAIEALINLDATHLEMLLSAADKFSRTAALELPLEERRRFSIEMTRFAAVLKETRHNLMLFSRWRQPAEEFGYTVQAEKTPWLD